MQWEKAKNLTIIFFILVNIMLGILNFTQKNHHTLSQEQENAIYTVLRQNKISIYSKIVKNYRPLYVLSVSDYIYDTDRLKDILFPSEASITHIESLNKEVFEWEDIRLTISNGYITYDNPSGYGGPPRIESKNAAAEVCDAFIQRNYPDYKLDGSLYVDEGWRFCYRQIYQKYMIHTNFIECLVTAKGIEQIDMQYGIPISFIGLQRDLCAPDEALLTFMQRIKGIRGDTPVIISRMDIVYFQDTALLATPYYRIFVENQETPFLINAYTNHML